MARKKKRFRTRSTAPAREVAPPPADEAQGMTQPPSDHVEPGESLTLSAAPASDAPAALASDAPAAPLSDAGSADQALPSPAEATPAVDSFPDGPDEATSTEEIQTADVDVATPYSTGPADDRPAVGVPSEPLQEGSAVEPTGDPVVTEAPAVEQEPLPSEPLPSEPVHEPLPPERVHEPLPPERVQDDYSAEVAPATQPQAEADEHDSEQEPSSTPASSPLPAPAASADEADIASPASTDYTPEEPVGGAVSKPVQGAAAWRRLLRMGLPRATKANLLGGLLAVLLGLAIATQVQLTQERGLSQLSQTDLIRVLDDVSLRSSRLDAQIRELEATRDRLRSGTGSSAEALAQAQKRVDTLGILAGTVAATGPGVVITLNDPNQALTGPIILDLIQELRDAGAEAIDVGGVRVVASSFVAEVDGDIAIDGIQVARPITIKAIGDAKTLSSAMTIPGGIVETVRQKKASAKVVEEETVEITSLHTAEDLKNARVVE